MGRKRRESAFEILMSQFWDMTGCFWQVGALITVVLIIGAAASAFWVINFEHGLGDNPINQIFKSLSWLFYSIPIIILFISYLFGRWTYYSYLKQNGLN